MKKSTRSNAPYLIPAILLALLAGAVVFLIFGMRGDVKVSGEAPEDETVESVTCMVGNLMYPFFTHDDSISKTTKIVMTFKGDKLANVFLTQKMNYDDAKAAGVSEASNHIAMNNSFAEKGYGADAFDANYTVNDKEMRMSLYADAKKLNEDAKKYFLATGTTNSKKVLIKNYETQGFSCNNK